MDLEPDRRERYMARCLGVVLGPLALVGCLWIGLGWRELLAGLAVVALALVLLLRAHRGVRRRRGTRTPA